MIKRSKVWIPSQEQWVPIQINEPDIIDSFTEAIMNEKDISEETKAQIERRCGKERRNLMMLRPFMSFHEPDQRRQTDRRGRKTIENLQDFVIGTLHLRITASECRKILEYLNY